MKLLPASVAAVVLLAAGLGWLAMRERAVVQPLELTPAVSRTEAASASEVSAVEASAPSAAADAEDSQRMSVSAPAPAAAAAPTVIEVIAQDGDGRPVERANAWIQFGTTPGLLFPVGSLSNALRAPSALDVRQGQLPSHAQTDAAGSVRFGLLEPSLLLQQAHITVRGGKSIATATLNAPLGSTRLVMILIPCARVEVSVLTALQRPLAGAYVDIATVSELDLLPAAARTTSDHNFRVSDELGRVVFDELQEGEYEFSCRDKSTAASARQRLAVQLGSRHFLELRLAAESASRAAVAGVVVDESGAALPKIRLRVQVDAAEAVMVTSNEQGEFGYFCADGREVAVEVGGGLWEDDFEPQPLRVPFGTSNVRLRRAKQLEHICVEMTCLDGSTGEAIGGLPAAGSRYRASAPLETASFHFDAKGRRSLMFKARDDWHVTIDALGFEHEDIALAEAMLPSPNGFAVTVRLRRSPDYQRLKDAGHLEDN